MKFLICHHLQVISNHPGPSSARILLGHFSKDYITLLVVYLPALLLGYKPLLFLIVFRIEPRSILRPLLPNYKIPE